MNKYTHKKITDFLHIRYLHTHTFGLVVDLYLTANRLQQCNISSMKKFRFPRVFTLCVSQESVPEAWHKYFLFMRPQNRF